MHPEYSVKSPGGTFIIEQRALVEGDKWSWQAWMCPAAAGVVPYQLPLWHDNELCWCGDFYIAPNGRYILHAQKTGSGASDGALFTRGPDGLFALMHSACVGPPFSERVWSFFRRTLRRDPKLSRSRMEFVAWGADGVCLELSLGGEDLGGGCRVHDWRLHYNLMSKRFFVTHDQILHNRRAITVPPPRSPEMRVLPGRR